MALTPGTRLGPYEILSALGAGGMGEVYRARDTRLDRTVAIKVLPSELAGDPDLRSRFEREARAVAALDHPHICGIYDVGSVDSTLYLVMPHLEGQTLAARLENGRLPLDQALKIAGEIADALDKAHRHGIIHRDLKPANIMLTKSGAKLLDFGLAKLRRTAGPISMSGMTELATPAPETANGMILGTVHYMAPEQVEGREADARSDIWALGVVIYEMTTGTRPFAGSTPASIIGSILKDDPAAISARQPLIPAMLDRLVGRCLQKEADARWQSAADLRQALEWIGEAARPSQAKETAPSFLKIRGLLPFLAVVALLAAVTVMFPGWWAHWREAPPEALQSSVLAPPNTTFSSPPASAIAPQIALSPDGRQLAFVAEAPRGRPMLWVRALDASEAQVLQGTEGATYPFWSPDSRALGFFAQGKLKTIEIAGGAPRTLSDAALDSRGGTWGPDGTIVFCPSPFSGLYQIAATTQGPATPITKLDPTRAEAGHRFPTFLPDGRHFLFNTRSERPEYWGISIASLDSRVGTPLIERTQWSAQFAEPGYILFLQAGTLMAQPFDLSRMATTGEAVAVVSSVGSTTTSYAAFSASRTGILAHAKQSGLPSELQWFDRSGKQLGSVGTPAEYIDVEISPDQSTVAVSRIDSKLSTGDIWLLDLARNLATKSTSGPAGVNASPVWSPDGGRIVFRSNRRGATNIYEKRANGTEAEQEVLSSGGNVVTSDWSLDGKYIVYTNTTSATGFDIWVWPTGGNAEPKIAVQTPLNDMQGRLSPDGRWIAYASDESGEMQVWVQPFPSTGEKRQISPDGGSEPRWRRDGNELFYLATRGTLMSVAVPGGNAFSAAAPQALFDVRVPPTSNPYWTNYAVTADGKRFLVNTRIGEPVSAINLISNWPALLRK